MPRAEDSTYWTNMLTFSVYLPNGIAWALFGRGIAGFLADDRRRQWFNIGMAVLLVVSVTPTLFE